MRIRRSMVTLLGGVLALSLAVPVMAQDEPIDLNAATVGPTGEPSTAVADISPLTDEEVAQISEGGYKAALLWAGAGTWYNALSKGAQERLAELGIEVVAESEADFDPARQQTDVETTMALQPDIILTLPVDPVAAVRPSGRPWRRAPSSSSWTTVSTATCPARTTWPSSRATTSAWARRPPS